MGIFTWIVILVCKNLDKVSYPRQLVCVNSFSRQVLCVGVEQIVHVVFPFEL